MAVGLKTLLEAAQYLEEQEQQQKSPLSNHINGKHLNDSNTSCFIAHYSLAVTGPRNASNATSNAISNDGNHKLDHIEGLLTNGGGGAGIAADSFAGRKATTCQSIVKNIEHKKQDQQHQQHIASSAPASTGFQQVAFGNGFSLTAKTKSPTELFIAGRKEINEANNNSKNANNNNNNNSINSTKGQLLTGAIIQSHINNHHNITNIPTNTNTSNLLNSSNANGNPNLIPNNNNNNNINTSDNTSNNNYKMQTDNKLNNINNINNNSMSDDFDSNSLSPPGPQRVRSASTSSHLYVFGALDHNKSAANQTNRLQTNLLHGNVTDGKGLQMMMVNDGTCESNLGSWMLNNQSPQRNNSMEGVSSIDSQMEVISPKNFTSIGSHSHTSLSSIGSNGRRRTMSSTSTGAGTREVHNKLEKNRRAHLKECYEKLKSQLNLKDEDRKKTSNLSVLGEALNQVIALQKKDKELEAKIEQLAKDKINSQKRIVMLKRELGPRYEQIFSGIFPDNEITMTSIPNERVNFNNTTSGTSLLSGRGSVLYSSSNSLSSSGGSSCSNNLLSSPGGVNHLQSSSTTIIPVIPKNNTAVMKMAGVTTTTATATATSAAGSLTTAVKSNGIFLQQEQQQQQQQSQEHEMGVVNNVSNMTSCPVSPSSAVVGVNNLVISTGSGNLPLSLTAQNISDTSLTRGSPTPSTPSPSPSSSSGVSSSSSFISSSPPIMNTVGIGNMNITNNLNNNNNNTSNVSGGGTLVTTTRQVCINIPNGLKFHVANNLANLGGGGGGGVFQGTIGNGTVTTAGTLNAINGLALTKNTKNW